MKRLLFFAFNALAFSIPSAFSAELAHELRGVWIAAAATESLCGKGDWERNRTDEMISVGVNSIEYWESSCSVQSVKKLGDTTYELQSACGGEGLRWRNKEIWHFQKVGSREELVALSLDRSDERDENGRRLRNPTKQQVSVTIYLGCK